MHSVTTSRQGLAIAWRAAMAYSVDGTKSRVLRVWRWPGYFLVMVLMAACAAGDIVWEGTASIAVPCRSRRPARALPGLSGLALALLVITAIGGITLASFGLTELGLRDVAQPAQVLAGLGVVVVLCGPVIGSQLWPRRVREAAALRRWRRDLRRTGHTVVVASSAAAWPMRGGAFSALLPEVLQEARECGQVILLHARNPAVADLYRRKGAQSHTRYPAVLVWR